MAQPANHEGEAQHEERVGEDRADERRLDHHDEALAQGEEADEELRQVAERRLHDTGRGVPEAGAKVVGRRTDEERERGEGHRGDREDEG